MDLCGFTLPNVLFYTLVVLLLRARADDTGPRLTPSCPESAEKCEFSLRIEERYTMMWYDGDDGQMLPVFARRNGTMRRSRDCQSFEPLSPYDESKIVIGDGIQKLSLMVNGQIPGPPIIVYEGQQVVVNVTNALMSEGTTIHWHGIHQRRSPWMDGVSGLSQCAINPGETFTYRFIADPAGTHWYHSHHPLQLSMGVYGPLIVLPRNNNQNIYRAVDPLPSFDGEFSMMVQDWFREPTATINQKNKHDAVNFADGFLEKCFHSTKQADGLDAGVYPFNSAVVNGKGRHYENGSVENPFVPVEIFHVKKEGKYRFRVVSAAMLFSFRVSVDGHVLNVISTDGNDVVTTKVESIVIFQGERYDFWIDALDADMLGSYWIRVETLERSRDNKIVSPGHGEAILSYRLRDIEDSPTSHRQSCTSQQPCNTLNCPFRAYPDSENQLCVPLTDLKSTEEHPTLPSTNKTNPFHEYFLNFHFVHGVVYKPTINGIAHKKPDKPLQIAPYPQSVKQCSECKSGLCECPHILHLPLHTVIQLTLVTTLDNPVGVRNGNVHPVHMHGHRFQVLKIGYSRTDPSDKLYLGDSDDIRCTTSGANCNEVTWSNPAWLGGNLPSLVQSGAPYKDTIAIPAGGYAVIRIATDNPGFWYMHCHIEVHNEEGMSMIIQEGDVTDMNAAPPCMNTCGNTLVPETEFLNRISNPIPAGVERPVLPTTGREEDTNLVYAASIVALMVIGALSLVLNMYLAFRLKKYRGYAYLNGSDVFN